MLPLNIQGSCKALVCFIAPIATMLHEKFDSYCSLLKLLNPSSETHFLSNILHQTLSWLRLLLKVTAPCPHKAGSLDTPNPKPSCSKPLIP